MGSFDGLQLLAASDGLRLSGLALPTPEGEKCRCDGFA